MKELRNLKLKKFYDSDEDDILNEFYIPLLSNSISYKRIAGYFSSSSFVVAAKGLTKFIENNGMMKLIINVNLSESDFNAIQEGIENPEHVIEVILTKGLNNLEDELISNHVKVLAWLIAKKRLEIKVAICNFNNSKSVFHQKIGIIEDELGACITFSGSDNESANGWLYNIEEFKVFRSWISEENDFVISDKDKFDKFWNNEGQRTRVYNIPTAIKNRLIKIAPNNDIEYSLVKEYIEKKVNTDKKLRKPRPYQLEAISNWKNNNCKGIFEMATGTGKTYAAILALKEIIHKEKGVLCVIAAPYQHLVTQWSQELKDEGINNIKLFGSKTTWKDKLMNLILKVNMGYKDNVIIVTTYDALSSDLLINSISQCNKRKMIIGDEVHSVGSEKRRKGLSDIYEFRLGLSATPSRWLDDEGTKVILDFFGESVFSFSLDDAIDHNFLTPYLYYPHFIELNNKELEEYKSYGQRIAIAAANKDKTGSDALALLLIKRKKIIVNAKNKFTKFIEILDKIKFVNKALFYCSPQQIKSVKKELTRRGIIFHRFTFRENIKLRDKIKEDFANGKYQALVAMKCLDEGVDIPATELGIILASTGNPKEYIQRRGRLLRRFPGKTKSIIHDIIVVPSFKTKLPKELLELERKILKGELKRYQEFANSSLNPLYASKMIISLEDLYGL